MGIEHYDKSFKERAVKSSYERGNVMEAASELGISGSQLRKWRKSYQ